MPEVIVVVKRLGSTCRVACLVWATGGCDGAESDEDRCNGDLQSTYAVGAFSVHFRCRTDPQTPEVQILHSANATKVLWQTPEDGRFVLGATAEVTIKEDRAAYSFDDRILVKCESATIDRAVPNENSSLTISGILTGAGCNVGYSLAFSTVPGLPNQLAFQLTLDPKKPEFNRVWLRYATSANEHFYGFGEQYSTLDMKGRVMPIVCQEQGIGRGDEPLTSQINTVVPGAGGEWYYTYAAVPQYITNEARSLFLENYEVSFFNFEDPAVVEIELLGPSMTGRILSGENPLDLVEEYTSFCGRMPALPDWINQGAVVGLQGGDGIVLNQLAQLELHNTPIAAFWLQDWVGNRKTAFGKQLWWNWQKNATQYPNWDRMVQTLNAKGIRVLTYINPFLVDIQDDSIEDRPTFDSNLYRDAKELGYLVLNSEGEPYPITTSTFAAGIVDFTNPAAVQWYKETVIKQNVLGSGASGWMADYAEAMPFDAVLYSGQSGASYHNQYPEVFAQINREAAEEAGVADDTLFFVRAAYTRSPGLARLLWAGDQTVNWGEHDGIKSAVKGLLSGGLSGFSLNHSDIGGFTTFDYGALVSAKRSKELLFRWMELAAFTSVYRTHEGLNPEANAQFYSDAESYQNFAKFAKVYKALAPYRKNLMEEAQQRGYPLVRHLMLHYPDDPVVFSLEYQWLLGTEFLVAPVLDEGAISINVYLPQGQWIHLWSGQTFGTTDAGGWQTIDDAGLGKPAVFYGKGSQAGADLVQALTREEIL